MARKVTVAVVLPVRDEVDEVVSTLDSIFANTRQPDEVLIADGRSTDGTVDRIRAYAREHGRAITIVDNPTLWSGGGRNRAIERTRCEVIIPADFGNLLDPEYFARMVAPFEERDVDIVSGVFRMRVDSEFEHCMAAIHYFENYTLDRYTQEELDALLPAVIAPGGTSIAITRDIWRRLGGYPEWLARAQDKMFSRKAYSLGAKIAVAWDAITYHHVRKSPGAAFKQLLRYGRGNGQSRYISFHVVKLAALYGGLLACLAGALVWPPSAAVGLVGYAAYVIKAAPLKVYRAAPDRFRPVHLLLAPLALVPRDLGTLLGHAYGWLEWLCISRYRRQFARYTRGCPSEKLHRLAR